MTELFYYAAAFALACVVAMWLLQRCTLPPRGRILSESEIEEGALPTFYTTPPHPERCKNFNRNGPTPCWHPHCACMGSRTRQRADELLRRHLHVTNPKRKSRVHSE